MNEFITEPLFLALCKECLETNTETDWEYRSGNVHGLLQDGKRATTRWLDGYLIGSDPSHRVPDVLATEVKGWSDNSLGGYVPAKKKGKATNLALTRGAFYWLKCEDWLLRGGPIKLDAKWHPPTGVPADAPSGVALIMYHLIEPPEGAKVTWPFPRTKSIFWYDSSDFQFHKRVLVFSVAKYIEERKCDEFEFLDECVEEKMNALRKLGVITT